MMSNGLSRWVIFDADNTLWQTEVLYDSARYEFCEFLAGKTGISLEDIANYQRQFDTALYPSYGYSASRFARSFEETCKKFLPNSSDLDLRHVRRLAERVFEEKARPYPGVDLLLRALSRSGYMLGLLTSGERWVQEKRLRDFHLTQMFRGILVVERKEVASFNRFCQQYNVDKKSSIVIGDSVRSDVNPALNAGLSVVWVQHPNWDEAEREPQIESDRLIVVKSIANVASAIGLEAYDPRPVVKSSLNAFGVFEGGGAKGLAHVGALKAAQERGIKFVGLGGASAGAIVAALHSVGYAADDLFDVDFNVERPFNEDWLPLIGVTEWSEGIKFVKEVRSRIEELLSGDNSWWARKIPLYSNMTSLARWNKLGMHLQGSLPGIKRTIAALGYFSTARFEAWLNNLLLAKVKCPIDGKTVTFQDIPFDLRIVSADTKSTRMIVHSAKLTPHESVAKSVCASIAIPVFFQPVHIARDGIDGLHLDGGLVSNFPAWLFIDAGGDDRTPIIGIELTDKDPRLDDGNGENVSPVDAIDFLASTVTTIVSGKRQLETRGLPYLYSIPVGVTASTFDFNMTNEAKRATFIEGRAATIEFFRNNQQLVSREQMAPVLYFAYKKMQDCLGEGMHLRVNIMDRIGTGDVAVRYSYNMDYDADEYLVFPEGAGGVGRCFDKRMPVLVDLEDAKLSFSEYSMKRVHQALVRPTLRSLLCVPLFYPSGENVPARDRRVIGVLNFDSDDSILTQFARWDRMAVDIATAVAVWWCRLATQADSGPP